jgi:DMSO/TMAO reductase YedYZ molybdopterin-dependent catalytic subunit
MALFIVRHQHAAERCPAADPQMGAMLLNHLSLRDLHSMPSQTLTATIECAGNGRTLFLPPVEGEKWNLGAVSTAEWTGVPLAEVLDRAGVRAQVREVLFRGADGGALADHSGPNRFERSLQIDTARHPDLLLAYAMNGEPLPIQHGYPVRLIVPGWYAVASVKWLAEIEIMDQPFSGHYQTDKYCYEWAYRRQTGSNSVTSGSPVIRAQPPRHR